MLSTFLLDPRFLDDCVSESTPEVEIAGEAAAYFTLGKSQKANYVFYQEDIGWDKVPSLLLGISHRERELLRSLLLSYQKANLLFLPASVSDATSDYLKPHADELLRKCEALYIRGKFLKGDAEMFKKHGVKVL